MKICLKKIPEGVENILSSKDKPFYFYFDRYLNHFKPLRTHLLCIQFTNTQSRKMKKRQERKQSKREKNSIKPIKSSIRPIDIFYWIDLSLNSHSILDYLSKWNLTDKNHENVKGLLDLILICYHLKENDFSLSIEKSF